MEDFSVNCWVFESWLSGVFLVMWRRAGGWGYIEYVTSFHCWWSSCHHCHVGLWRSYVFWSRHQADYLCQLFTREISRAEPGCEQMPEASWHLIQRCYSSYPSDSRVPDAPADSSPHISIKLIVWIGIHGEGLLMYAGLFWNVERRNWSGPSVFGINWRFMPHVDETTTWIKASFPFWGLAVRPLSSHMSPCPMAHITITQTILVLELTI